MLTLQVIVEWYAFAGLPLFVVALSALMVLSDLVSSWKVPAFQEENKAVKGIKFPSQPVVGPAYPKTMDALQGRPLVLILEELEAPPEVLVYRRPGKPPVTALQQGWYKD